MTPMGEGDVAAERVRLAYRALLRAEAEAQQANWVDVDGATAEAAVTCFVEEGADWVRVDGLFGRTIEFELGSDAEITAFLAELARDQIADLVDDHRDGPARG